MTRSQARGRRTCAGGRGSFGSFATPHQSHCARKEEEGTCRKNPQRLADPLLKLVQHDPLVPPLLPLQRRPHQIILQRTPTPHPSKPLRQPRHTLDRFVVRLRRVPEARIEKFVLCLREGGLESREGGLVGVDGGFQVRRWGRDVVPVRTELVGVAGRDGGRTRGGRFW